MKILPLLFGSIFQSSAGHEIARRNAGPISATNLCINECTGVADDWKNFYHKEGIYVDVDISHCGLTKVSRVITWMTCRSGCWAASGSDKIYNLTNDGFRVYLNNFGARALFPDTDPDDYLVDGRPFIPAYAKEKNFELHYEVKGICNEIPGSV